MKLRRSYLSLCLLSSTFSSLPAFAQDSDANAEVEQILITASRMQKPASSIPNTVTVIDKELLDYQVMIDDSIAGVLEKTVPGFSPSTQKMSGSGETLRGKNPLYMIDGVTQHNSLRDGLRDGFSIDNDFLESIEVIQGANAIQGVGATGGVVNLVTKRATGDGQWNSEIKSRLSTDDSVDSDSFGYKLTYIGDIKTETYDFVGGVSMHHRGIFFDANGDRVGYRTAQGELQDSDALDLFIKAGVNFADDQRVQLMYNKYELENNGKLIPVSGDRDAGIYATSIDGNSKSTVGNPAKNDVQTLTLDYTHSDLFGGKFGAQFYYQDYSALFEGSESTRWALVYGGDAFLDQSEIISDKSGIKLNYEIANLADIDGLRSLIGYDYGVDNTSQELALTGRAWVPEMSLVTSSPLLQVEYQAGELLLLSAGVRLESADLEVDDFETLPFYNNTFVEGGTPSFTEALTNVGIVYHLTEAVSLYTSYSEGFDMPDVGRVLRAIETEGLDVDSLVDISPIITDNTEIGMNLNFDKWTAQLSVYQSKTDLGSRLEADSDGIYTVSREKQESWGYDVVVSYYINDDWVVGGNYAYIDGRYDSDDDGKTDTDLSNANQSPPRLNLYLQGSVDNLSGKLQLSYLFDRTQQGLAAYTDNRRTFDGYTTVDLSVNYDTEVGKFGLGIENLLNEDYETLYSQNQNTDANYFSARGRRLAVSYAYSF